MSQWIGNDSPSRAAAVAFFATFALLPLTSLVLLVASLFVDSRTSGIFLTQQLTTLVGDTAATAVQQMIAHSEQRAHTSLSVIAMASLLIAASATFIELRHALNQMLKVSAADMPPPTGSQQVSRWIASYMRARLLSLSAVTGLGFLLVGWLFVDTLVTVALNRYASESTQLVGFIVSTCTSIVVVTAAFFLLLKVLPDRRLASDHVWVGAVIAALLFVAGKWIMSLALAHAFELGAFGPAAGLITLLLWIYFAANVFLLGAQVAVLRQDQAKSHAKRSVHSAA